MAVRILALFMFLFRHATLGGRGVPLGHTLRRPFKLFQNSVQLRLDPLQRGNCLISVHLRTPSGPFVFAGILFLQFRLGRAVGAGEPEIYDPADEYRRSDLRPGETGGYRQ